MTRVEVRRLNQSGFGEFIRRQARSRPKQACYEFIWTGSGHYKPGDFAEIDHVKHKYAGSTGQTGRGARPSIHGS